MKGNIMKNRIFPKWVNVTYHSDDGGINVGPYHYETVKVSKKWPLWEDIVGCVLPKMQEDGSMYAILSDTSYQNGTVLHRYNDSIIGTSYDVFESYYDITVQDFLGVMRANSLIPVS